MARRKDILAVLCMQKTPPAQPRTHAETAKKKKKQTEDWLALRGERLARLIDDIATLSHLATLGSWSGASEAAKKYPSHSRARAKRATT